jgi:hypothetical protein
MVSTVPRHNRSYLAPAGLVLATAVCLTLATSLLAPRTGRSAREATAPLAPLPAGWPRTLELGMMDGPGGAAALKARAAVGFRYQYLAGGVKTGNGWADWNPDGDFVTSYVQESVASGIIPVFTYYMLTQSRPGDTASEQQASIANLQNRSTMTAYYDDLRLFFQRAGAFSGTLIVLHVEPDLWGFAQQRARGNRADTVPVQVAATGEPELAGLPDDLRGFAQAIGGLRDRYAPNVLLGYHLSTWGTGNEMVHTRPPAVVVGELADRAAAYYASLDQPFDLIFAEFSDRDAGFKEHVSGDRGASWWRPDDFERHARFLARFAAATRRRIVLWQIPYGNTRMRAMNNTWQHYQDNRIEWLLDDPSRQHLREYVDAGVIALLFGQGAAGTTCPCDAAGDGETNPEPINGNTGWSLSADDDGGYFQQLVTQYHVSRRVTLAD